MIPPLRFALPAALALLSSACAALSGAPPVPPLPAQARAEPARFVVVTVRNRPQPRAARAGSTPRGYDGVGAYGVTAAASETVHALERRYGLHQVSAWPISTLHVHCIVFRLPPSTARPALIAQLARDPRVESAQPLNEFTTEADPDAASGASSRPPWMPYNDPYAPLQRALRELDVVGAQRESRGAGVRIAIVDSGVDLGHPDLRGRIIAHRNFVDADERQFMLDRHGTEVAGVIAAVANNGLGIVGVAPDARLLVYKSCWQPRGGAERAVCDSFTLAQGLEAAILAHADIVNLSLAGPADPLLTRLVRDGERQGMLFVGAIAPSPGAGFPARIPGVLAVDSVDDGASNPSAPAGRLLAPGREVLTLVPEGHYDFASGSSLATAEVSGILALMISGEHRLAPAAAARILEGSARSADAGAGGPASVNACRAVAELRGRGGCQSRRGPFADVKTGSPLVR